VVPHIDLDVGVLGSFVADVAVDAYCAESRRPLRILADEFPGRCIVREGHREETRQLGGNAAAVIDDEESHRYPPQILHQLIGGGEAWLVRPTEPASIGENLARPQHEMTWSRFAHGNLGDEDSLSGSVRSDDDDGVAEALILSNQLGHVHHGTPR